jgi:hypothetical protein
VDDRQNALRADPRARVTLMADIQRPETPRRRVSPRLLSLLISAGLLALCAWILGHRIDWTGVVSVLTGLHPALAAAAMAVYWLQYPSAAYRFQRVISWAMGRPPSDAPFWFIFKLNGSAAFVAVAAPIGLAGDAAKIAGLRLFGSLSITDAARCALFDRVMGVKWLGLLGLASLPFQIVLKVDQTTVLAQLALFAGIIAGVGVLLVFPATLRIFRYAFIQKLARVFDGYRAMLHPDRVAVQLGIAVINFAFAWGSLYLLLRAADLDSNVWLVGCFIPLLQLINGLPFLYMGWGGRELAMAATLGGAGALTASETLAISVAWGIVLILSGTVNGLFLLGDWRTHTGRPKPDTNVDSAGGQAL